MTTIATIDVDGKKIRVLPKDYQLDPVRDFTVHVDFLRVSGNTPVTVEIPVHFVNEEKSPGLKIGGVLNIVRHEVEVHCPADDIPEFLTADLSGLQDRRQHPHLGHQAAEGRDPGHHRPRLHDRNDRRSGWRHFGRKQAKKKPALNRRLHRDAVRPASPRGRRVFHVSILIEVVRNISFLKSILDLNPLTPWFQQHLTHS